MDWSIFISLFINPLFCIENDVAMNWSSHNMKVNLPIGQHIRTLSTFLGDNKVD